MKVAFIACEYNPFHNGHAYHINKTKESGVDAVICIMSGNFVQRGEVALLEKHARCRMALMCGADIVIELPLKYAIATASLFADGFVRTAASTGLDGEISFGCKNSIEDLAELRNIIDSSDAQKFINDSRSFNTSYPAALADYLLNNFDKKYYDLISDANNVLALEYLRSKNLYFPEAGIISISRFGAQHDYSYPINEFASASYIRKNICNQPESIKKYIPKEAYSVLCEEIENNHFSSSELYDKIMFSRILSFDVEEISEINNVCGGLENRIYDCIKNSADLSELANKIKSKNFTHSRIRQIILSLALGVKKSDYSEGIEYLRILGCNNKGREVLKEIKSSSSIPYIMNLSEIDNNNEIAVKNARMDFLAGKLFDLCSFSSKGGNPEYDIPPVII